MASTKKVSLRLKLATVAALAILVVALFVASSLWVMSQKQEKPLSVNIGVTAGGNVTETKALIDKVKTYTNIIIFTNLAVTTNITSLTEVADYAYNNGLNFFIQTVFPSPFSRINFNPITWASEAKAKYSSYFLGYYLYDEPGGNQLDVSGFYQFDKSTRPSDYRDAANTYTYYLYIQMRDFIKNNTLVTSDYGLYWYDYEAGYDSIFTQFGWNNSRPLDIALCRGAAELHNKTWGAIITWTYTQAPYIESPSELYQDMVTAYNAGAKYIVVFNYAPTSPGGILTDQHFEAIQNFWNHAKTTTQNRTSNIQKLAYVLPDNYGFGFRSATDSIWGVWGPDNFTSTIWAGVNKMQQTYGDGFDILIGSLWTQAFARYHYTTLIRWNSTL
jgi:hypothetical protein